MATFCLLHSSGQGPDGYRLVREALERRGHAAMTPAFRIDETDRGAAWHAATIVEQLQHSGAHASDTICVGHSAAGAFLPLVAQRWRPRRMVFLAALVPQPGTSIRDQLRADASMINPAWIGKDPMHDDVALEFVYHDCPRERIAWALSTRVSFYAQRAMEEPCPLVAWPDIPAAYIVCADDRTITPGWQRRAARERLRVEPIELQGGHCPNVARPEALADVLATIALEALR